MRNYLVFLTMNINSRIDITQVFCDVDDFYKAFQKYSQSVPKLTPFVGEKLCHSRLSLSEVMTIEELIFYRGNPYIAVKLLVSRIGYCKRVPSIKNELFV